jgi:superfamily II DNA or RNA helicase
MKLRAYQQEAHDSALRAWGVGPWYEADGSDIYRAILLNLATSAGKTIIAAKIIETLVGLGYRCLFIADTDELCQQASDKILAATGIKATIEKAGDKANLADAVCVASAQTLSREDRLARFSPEHFDFIICDEIHRGTDRASKIFNYFCNARICGITATAFRAKQKDLSKWFDHVAYELGTFDLIGQGYAPPIKVQTLEISMDISAVRQSAGADGQDFNATELGDTIEPYFAEIIEQIRIHAADRQILAFLPLIATSDKFVDMCNAAGIDSRHIDGKSDDREGILRAFAEKKFQLLSNASLLSTGWDCPSVDCLLCLRPTRSPGLYRQMAGRIIRTLPGIVEGLATAEERKAAIAASGKSDALILDPLWLSGQFELSGPVSLIAEDAEEAEALEKKVRKATGTPQELEEMRRQVQAEREERLRDRLEHAAKEAGMNKQGLIDAGAFGYLLHNRRLIKYTPAMASDVLPVTDLQIKWLTQSKIDPATVTCSGHARMVLNAAWDRKKNGLCPVVMLWRLSLRGITGAEGMTVAQAEDAAGDCLWSFGKKAGTPFSEFTQRDIAFWRGFMRDKPDMIARFPKEAAFVGAA